MKIEEALKVNEKVKRPLWLEDEYIMIQDDKFVGPDGLLVGLDPEDAFADDWQPFPEEIRPENGNEFWVNKDGDTASTYEDVHGKTHILHSDRGKVPIALLIGSLATDKEIIHNKNGWERIFPKPEDDSVETNKINIPSGYKKVYGGFIEPGYLVWRREGVFESIAKSSLSGLFGRVETYSCVIRPNT